MRSPRPVDHDDRQGRAGFPFGVCRMRADADALAMQCEAADTGVLERVESVVGVHLERFAWHGRPAVAWTAG